MIRLHPAPLIFVSVLSLMCCTTQVVNTQTTTIRADTTSRTEIELESEPTPDRPAADFHAYRFTEVKDTKVRTAWLRHRPARAAWVGTVGTILAGGVVGGLLLASGRVVLGRDIMAVSAVPLAGIALASLGSFRRAATFIDTSRTTTPLPVAVVCGSVRVATLYPDEHGTAEFQLKDHLDALTSVTTDTVLTVSVAGSQGPSRDFALTRDVYASAARLRQIELEEQAEAVARRERAETEMARCAALAAEIDTACRVIEGLDCAYGAGAVVIYHEMSGSLDSGQPYAAQYVREQADWFNRCRSMYTRIRKPDRLRATYAVIDELLPELSRFVRMVTEMEDQGGLTSSAAAELSGTWKLLYPEGKRALFVRIEKPLKQDLRTYGLSQSLVGSIWEDLKFSCWTREVKTGSTVVLSPQRDSVFPLILEELRTSRAAFK